MRSTSKTRDMFVFYMRVEIGFCCVVFVLGTGKAREKKFYTKAFISNISHLAQHKLLSFEVRRSNISTSEHAHSFAHLFYQDFTFKG